MLHALNLGAIGLAARIAGVVVAWNRVAEFGPHWYPGGAGGVRWCRSPRWVASLVRCRGERGQRNHEPPVICELLLDADRDRQRRGCVDPGFRRDQMQHKPNPKCDAKEFMRRQA
jgi:hypothetical protein